MHGWQNFQKCGIKNPQRIPPYRGIHSEVRKHGVKLALGYSVEGFAEKNNGVDKRIDVLATAIHAGTDR